MTTQMHILQNKKNGKRGGFTIVETLVAIAILMIAVAGPLVAANRGLNAALYSRDQMIALFLAQESMEIIKNTRSNGPATWLNDYSSCYDSESPCDVGAAEGLQTNCSPDGCSITLGNFGYQRSGGGAADSHEYFRSFYLEDMDPGDTQLPEEVRAHVIVKWNQGKIPYQIEVVSEIIDVNI